MTMPSNHQHGQEQLLDNKQKLQPPPMYKVIIMNDDYTPMDFVIEVLMRYFLMDQERATDTMLTVHFKGSAVCGVYSYEVAETKVSHVNHYARTHEHPLLCIMERA
ncbi:ATP-dependent Clp protease adaptor protein ClpS [Pseudidiomarina indica]|uniref:ATP-dependent Clp protease adapter protein ClpS n=1 Tax=Pseudidiomarina indica TaxID=1159017 RepID=A0A1G6A3L4_9GAMM|nr:ATP-dependent Clp protease adaptor protein ClpS [Pseudidiomarina indica]